MFEIGCIDKFNYALWQINSILLEWNIHFLNMMGWHFAYLIRSNSISSQVAQWQKNQWLSAFKYHDNFISIGICPTSLPALIFSTKKSDCSFLWIVVYQIIELLINKVKQSKREHQIRCLLITRSFKKLYIQRKSLN